MEDREFSEIQRLITYAENRISLLENLLRKVHSDFRPNISGTEWNNQVDEVLGTRPAGCCCPPKGHSGIWAAAMCPVHFGLKSLGLTEASEAPIHICDGCGEQGWTASCDKCIPY